ncbi:MAG: hypothetical protein FWG10_09065 [Eubacteriaceae bacterium]|nr:hypothetical protein [Eubacteriaceae bacterium]
MEIIAWHVSKGYVRLLVPVPPNLPPIKLVQC